MRRLIRHFSTLILVLALGEVEALAATPGTLHGANGSCQDTSSNAPQSAPQKVAESKAEPAADSKPILKAGTPVRLRFLRTISSSNVIAGERVNLEAVEDINVGDLLVIAKSSLAEATVTVALPKNAMGRGGDLALKIETVPLASGQRASLRFVEDLKGGNRKGVTPTGIVLGAIAAPGLLVYYIPGKDAVVQKGTEVTAYVDQDVLIDPSRLPAPISHGKGGEETHKDEDVPR
jgi:hypothetical protein